jgi:hypothetical protein
MTDFEIAALLHAFMMLCACFVMLIGAVMVWKFSASAKEGEIKFSAGKLLSMEFRQVGAGLIVIIFGAALMIVAIQKPISTHHVTGGLTDVEAVRGPTVEAPREDWTVGSAAKKDGK